MLKNNNEKFQYMLFLLDETMRKVCESLDSDVIEIIGSTFTEPGYLSLSTNHNINEVLLIKKLREVYRSK